MEITVKLNNLRTAPRKVRQVVDLVRGKKVLEAQSLLTFTVNKSARSVLKLLDSALATVKNDLHLDESNLFISKITVDEGPKLKRWHPMSRGRAYPIIKRSSHIAITLSDKNPKAKKEDIKENKKEVEVKKAEEKVTKKPAVAKALVGKTKKIKK